MQNWTLTYSHYAPEQERLREALLTLGNGYFATRGAAEEASAGERHYPGTYLAGGYNRLQTEISDKLIENEDLVNWPDWTLLKFKPVDGGWLDLDKFHIKEYQQELDLQKGILKRTFLFQDEKHRETKLVSRRIVSMGDKHMAAIEWELTPLNWSGEIIIHSAIDGTVINDGVARYRDLKSKHLNVLKKGGNEEDCIYLKVSTTQSEVVMAQSAKTLITLDQYESPIERTTLTEEEYIAQELLLNAEENKTIRIEKLVALYTSKDAASSEALLEAKQSVKRAESFKALQEESAIAWENLWEQCDIEVKVEDPQDQLLLRLHIFHLLQTYSLNSIDLDVGVPARGWHGEAYRGHIFWDELFIFPFFNVNTPELSRSLLMYRYRRLAEARYAAKQQGYDGAMYPWQSGSNGREESQEIHLNPQSGRWIPDNTHLQRHVNSAVAYNVWRYFEATGDLEFLANYGAEMLLDIAKFWASKVMYNADRKKYEIHGIVGPDEYHTAYPKSKSPGLKNNAYTNVMAAWVLHKAMESLKQITGSRAEDLLEMLKIDQEDLKRWEKISRNMYVPFIEGGKVIEQFEDFDNLEELNWKKYHEKYGEIIRLDRILEKQGDKINNYKAAKQADVFMLFYLFTFDELNALFNRLGYDFKAEEQILDNIAYYEGLTSHGSTLSQLVHSWVYARSQREKSWHNFKKALLSDFKDVQGGTTPEGIHLGAMVGTVSLILICYTGLNVSRHVVKFDPKLPENIKHIKFRLRSMKHWLDVKITEKSLQLTSHGGWEDPIEIALPGKRVTIEKGETKTIDY